MAENVAADAQFSLVTVLKPFVGFEDKYQGQAATIPVAFPGTIATEAKSGTAGTQSGFDPNLLSGLRVPLGSRIQLWIPQAGGNDGEGQPVSSYQYFVAWRYRNVRDFRIDRRPYHIRDQRAGIPDTTAPVGTQERSVIPAAIRSVLYEPANPGGFANALADLRVEAIVPTLNNLAIQPPFLPNGNRAVIQQGIFDPTVFGTVASNPIWQPVWLDAEGDEMIIFATRVDVTNPWNFAVGGEDFGFSDIYGDGDNRHAVLPNVGIYVVTGSNP